MNPKPKVLIIDDDRNFIQDLCVLLDSRFECISANDGGKGLQNIHQMNPEVVLLDLMLGSENGLDILKHIHRYDETLPVIMVTDYASVDTAVKAIRMGAFNYISKSPKLKELILLLENAIEHRRDSLRTISLKDEVNQPYNTLIGHSPAMEQVLEKIRLYADHKNTVLITGESGVGKELVARQIHQKGPYADEPFVAINCAAIPRDLVESELFGHEKGAFTGADKRKIGKFEMAGDGIIFLDEISELSQDIQVKLLRVLQEREFQRVGGNSVIRSNAKIVAATNKDLWEQTTSGAFREDLYYRLDVLPIEVPPLRERREDIAELMSYFIRISCEEMKQPVKSYDQEVLDAFRQFDWPGNIRQLKNYVTRMVIKTKEPMIKLDQVDPELRAHIGFTGTNGLNIPDFPTTWDELNTLRKQVAEHASREVEKKFIHYLMDKFDHNVSRAADHIGINRSNLHKMINRVKEY